MGSLKKKPAINIQKINHEDSTAVSKKPIVPVKAEPRDNNVGGIFSTKLVAIWKKIFGK